MTPPRPSSVDPHTEITAWSLTPLFLCALLAGCRNDPPATGGTILVSGDTGGWITPCGCASNQSGGLPRRADLARQIQADGQLVVVDVGGAPGGTSPYDRLRFEAILRGELAMGLVAHNLGRAEVLLGPDELRRLARELQIPWLSANVADRSGRPLGQPVRITQCGGVRVALVGVLDPAFATAAVSVSPVVPAVLAALQSVSGRYDAVVVLAYLGEDTLRETAHMLPEADAVIGGPTGQPIPPTPVGPTLLASATNQGKFVLRLDVDPTNIPWQARIVELDDSFADDPRQTKNVQQFYDDLAQRKFTPDETSFVPTTASAETAGSVAGNINCKSCHEEDYDAWVRSPHAHAWQSLQTKSAHVDPECQRCHTTGYGLPGGYNGLTTRVKRFNVGCESCHGPSQDHALEPDTPTGWHGRADDSCTDCHDRENSPHFDYQVYWPKIVHGDHPQQESPEEAKR